MSLQHAFEGFLFKTVVVLMGLRDIKNIDDDLLISEILSMQCFIFTKKFLVLNQHIL